MPELLSCWPLVILAVAVSIDGFSVGVTYGLRGIKLGMLALLIISGIASSSIYLSSALGAGIARLVNPELAGLLGSIILILIGSWLVYSAYFNFNGHNGKPEQRVILSLKIKFLGIIIKILKEPIRADLDRSGTINNFEAVMLGLALALDGLGAGLSVGLTGLTNLTFPLLIALVNLVFVGGGFLIGRKLGDILPEHFAVFPGFVIIILGIIKLF